MNILINFKSNGKHNLKNILCSVYLQKMWQVMSHNPDYFVQNSLEGVNRVKKGGYAFFLESTTNEYVRERDCDLIQIGGLLDNKGYGFGTPSCIFNQIFRFLVSQ